MTENSVKNYLKYVRDVLGIRYLQGEKEANPSVFQDILHEKIGKTFYSNQEYDPQHHTLGYVNLIQGAKTSLFEPENDLQFEKLRRAMKRSDKNSWALDVLFEYSEGGPLEKSDLLALIEDLVRSGIEFRWMVFFVSDEQTQIDQEIDLETQDPQTHEKKSYRVLLLPSPYRFRLNPGLKKSSWEFIQRFMSSM